ncbi:MAG: hypothetical protein ABSF61_11715 [Anaerolineales bacterium]
MAIRNRASLLILSVWIAFITGCNFPLFNLAPNSGSGGGVPAVPLQTSTNVPSGPSSATATETITPVPSIPPTVTPTPTSSTPMVSPIDKDVACRFGPGDVYSIEGSLAVGHTVPIQGRDSPGGWWYIENPGHAGRYCWVASSATQTQGDTSIVAVVPPPIPFVDYVGVDLSPSSKDIACGTFPYTFGVNFKIEFNGPIKLTFQRIKSDGHTAPPETYVYSAAGTQSYSDSYRVGAPGSYWFKVQVTSPNSISGQGSAKMTCH